MNPAYLEKITGFLTNELTCPVWLMILLCICVLIGAVALGLLAGKNALVGRLKAEATAACTDATVFHRRLCLIEDDIRKRFLEQEQPVPVKLDPVLESKLHSAMATLHLAEVKRQLSVADAEALEKDYPSSKS